MNRLGFSKSSLNRRDWVYVLSLLGPFIAYDLAMKASAVALLPGDHGLGSLLDVMWPNASFDLGYTLLWVGLFAATGGGGLPRRAVVVLFYAATTLLVIITTCAYQYYQETGTTLDFGIVALFLASPGEISTMFQSVSVLAWALLALALFYTVLGPSLVTRAIERWRGRGAPAGRPQAPSFLLAGGLFLVALGFGSLSLLMSTASATGGKSFASAPLVNLVVTGVEDSADDEDVGPPVVNPAAHARLAPTPQTHKRNVVLIHLESTRAESVTPYNESLKTTPFLDDLAKESLLAERDYTTVPHTSKASVSVNCGVYPHLVSSSTEALPDGIPAPCLASLLKDQGYSTAFFQSSTKRFENFQGLVKNFGYEEYYPLETMDKKDFKKTNYFGYEDDIMLAPSEGWLKDHGDRPFMAEYLLGTGHHDYQCLGTSHGDEDFSNEEPLNSYLNCMRLQDIFVENLIDQYKELGLYENTIFVLFGDHGEGFGEHGLLGHNNTIYEEGLRVPLIIHAPGWFENGARVKGLSNHTDILPTVLEMLGYEVENGEYPGYSLLREPPEDRRLTFSCWLESSCLASVEGTEKYIYHYGDRPDEVFDLSKDPSEQENLADEHPEEEVDGWREDLLSWRSGIEAQYVEG